MWKGDHIYVVSIDTCFSWKLQEGKLLVIKYMLLNVKIIMNLELYDLNFIYFFPQSLSSLFLFVLPEHFNIVYHLKNKTLLNKFVI